MTTPAAMVPARRAEEWVAQDYLAERLVGVRVRPVKL